MKISLKRILLANGLGLFFTIILWLGVLELYLFEGINRTFWTYASIILFTIACGYFFTNRSDFSKGILIGAIINGVSEALIRYGILEPDRVTTGLTQTILLSIVVTIAVFASIHYTGSLILAIEKRHKIEKSIYN